MKQSIICELHSLPCICFQNLVRTKYRLGCQEALVYIAEKYKLVDGDDDVQDSLSSIFLYSTHR